MAGRVDWKGEGTEPSQALVRGSVTRPLETLLGTGAGWCELGWLDGSGNAQRCWAER